MRQWSAIIGFLVWGSGCTGSPQPEPAPSGSPLALDRISVESTAGRVEFRGAPGAAAEYAAQLWGIGLSTAERSALSPIAGDGSFAVSVPGTSNERYRIHVEVAPGVTATSDIALDLASMRPIEIDGCGVRSNPRFVNLGDLAVGSTATEVLTLVNRCDSPIIARAVARIIGSGSASLELPQPTMIAPHEYSDVTLTGSPRQPGEFVEILAVEFSDGVPFVITVTGRGQ